ncbi:MgtC/SapB family protein [Butyricicoccus sp.]|uniref:MgtC/SapB family protein n=1 Tax=Butyricicoccus sp. TaxID=2049021 RepID=UPI003F16C558
MAAAWAYLHEFNMASVTLRLVLAMVSGGMIGMERGRKRRAAGFRTYILVCLGAALTMLLSQYEFTMLSTRWSALAEEIGLRTDISRFGAQVINGIGFLGAGTILVTGHQQITGLTTAAGLWASACMGLAIGAGFYECVIPAFVLIFLCIRVFPIVDGLIQENSRAMHIYVELESLDNVGTIIGRVKSQNMQIFDLDIERGREKRGQYPSIVFSVRLNQRRSHAQVLSTIADLDCIRVIREI